MAKSNNVYTHGYNCKLDRVVDGDTCDAMIDLGFSTWKKIRIRFYGVDTWESRTRDKEEKVKGLAAKARNKELLESGLFKIVSHGTGKFGRVLGEVFVEPKSVDINTSEAQYFDVKESSDGLISVNDILIAEGHAYEYDGGKKKKFISEIETEITGKKQDLVDKPAEENQ